MCIIVPTISTSSLFTVLHEFKYLRFLAAFSVEVKFSRLANFGRKAKYKCCLLHPASLSFMTFAIGVFIDISYFCFNSVLFLFYVHDRPILFMGYLSAFNKRYLYDSLVFRHETDELEYRTLTAKISRLTVFNHTIS